ncbi:MAG TPA: hypothetical protein VL651_13535 [Bacteroidia bacterium]|jgi:hypothetical protein|nr:hypothetical protein [Bacteroidia bacterium]
MTWWRRIRLYLTGFGIGCILVWILFFRNGNRELGSWLPSNRVTYFLQAVKKMGVDSTTLCKMKCAGFTMEDVKAGLKNADVNFDKSNTSKEPCHEYDVNMTIKGKKMEVYFSACTDDSTASLLLFNPPLDEGCGCSDQL